LCNQPETKLNDPKTLFALKYDLSSVSFSLTTHFEQILNDKLKSQILN